MLELTLNGTKESLPDGALDDAMKRFWEAKSSGDATADIRRMRLDDANQFVPVEVLDEDDESLAPEIRAAETDDVDLADAPVVPSAAPTPAGQVSPVAEARIAEQSRVLTDNGFALPPPIFAAGTRVLPLGDENFRLERTRVEDLPLFPDTAEGLLVRVGEELREDMPVQVKELFLCPDGTLLHGQEEFRLESDAFLQLSSLAGFACGARYLSQLCDVELRAHNVNAQIAKLSSRGAVLRTRYVREVRSVFAVVSPSYASVDGADALMRIAPALGDARTELVYDGKTTVATGLWMPNVMDDLAAGDVFKVGVRIEAEDTGRGRIRIAAVAWRNLCLNLLIIAEGESEVASVVHRGDPKAILDRLPGFVEQARGKVSAFLDAWGHARTLRIDIVATFKMWVEEKAVVVRGERRADNVVNALLTAWQKEPGDTLADAVNALTRAAHETPHWSREIREDLQRQAGRLVFTSR